jgi:hypothetical protein
LDAREQFVGGDPCRSFALERLKPSVEFCLLLGRQGDRVALLGAEAVPQLLDQLQSLIRSELVNVDGGPCHTSKYPTSKARRGGFHPAPTLVMGNDLVVSQRFGLAEPEEFAKLRDSSP